MTLYNRPIYLSAITLLWVLLLLMLIPTTYVLFNQQIYILEWSLMSMSSTPIIMTLIADPMGLMFSCVVLLISANVLMFSTIYMHSDVFINRFTVLVLLFILSMNLLIFIPHFMILLLGWDGLGIVSFILVIYYQNPKSLAAGMITALTNRVGDVMLLLSIAWTLNQGHWLIINMWNTPMLNMQIFCIAVAAMTKSAQMPFSSWLPAAMAAPTPVSALVHSSTLVTAGVFLMIRFYPFLHSLKSFNTVMLMIAVCTMLMAGISATTECDMKKIIALSTLSQLGMMMTGIGLNAPNLAYYHMLTHALFKALLFICAGSFINLHLHTQDLRWMGNLMSQLPIAVSCITIANLALCGFPFMAGFYSKDLIVEFAMTAPNNMLMVLLILLSLGLTSFYSTRFSLATLWSPNSCNPMLKMEENKMIAIPMINLSLMSIVSGSMMSWLPIMSKNVFILPLSLKLSPLIMVLIGLLIGWSMTSSTSNNLSILIKQQYNHWASCSMWYLAPLSSQFLMKAPLISSHHLMKTMDQGWLEVMSGQGANFSLITLNNTLINKMPGTPTGYLMGALIMSTTVMVIIFMY